MEIKMNEFQSILGLGMSKMYAKRISPSAAPSASPSASAAPTSTFYFDAYDIGGEEWFSNPEKMVDGSLLTEASSIISADIQLLTGNTCDGTDLGIITKVELRGHGKTSDSGIRIDIRPVFILGDGDDHDTGFGQNVEQWENYIDITNDTNSPAVTGSWTWTDVAALDCNIFHAAGAGLPYECQKVEIRING